MACQYSSVMMGTIQHSMTTLATGSLSTNAYVHSAHAGCYDIIDVSAVQAQLCTVLYVNNVYTACHNLGISCSLTWIHIYHTYAGLTMLVYIYTALLYGAMTWHHSDQHVWATCSVYNSGLPHQNDGYNTDTCVTLQVETSYYTGCTATH